MKMSRLRLFSNNMSYGPWPEPGAEVKQHLTITVDGWVVFSTYGWDGPPDQYRKLSSRVFHVDPAEAKKILEAVVARLNTGQDELFDTAVGTWDLELSNCEGECDKLRGSLCAEPSTDFAILSDLIRDTLGMRNLFAFDGNPDRVDRVTVDYHRFTRTDTKAPDSGETIYQNWHCTEQLVVDRASSTVELVQRTASGCVFSQKLQSEDVVDLLDDLNPNSLFGVIEGNPEDAVDDPMNTRDYTITVDFRHRPQCILQGSYDKKALPEDWGDFADALWWLLQSHGRGELLDPTVYGRIKRRTSDLMYCGVEFEGGGKRYHYISDDEEIAVGDYVLVPVGNDNHHSAARVAETGFYPENQVPFPIEETKHIIERLPRIENTSKLKTVKDDPETDIVEAHLHSYRNRRALEQADVCGCFHCLKIFSPKEIAEYVDDHQTAICPYCAVDAVIGENSGFPVTQDFLLRMRRKWFDSGSGMELVTPFGRIQVKLDGRPICFSYEAHEPIEGLFPDVDGIYRIGVEVQQDGRNHSLKLELSSDGTSGEPEPGEMLEALSFYRNGGKITLGCYAAFGEMNAYGLDFDGQWDDSGIEVLIFPFTKTHTYQFGVCWLNTCTEETDVQTWYGADPSI